MASGGADGEHRLVVDRVEGELVVVELEGGVTLDLPRWLVPPDLREGDVVRASAAPDPDGGGWRVVLRVDAEETRAARDRVAERLARLRERDPGGDIEL